ncbi:3-hydroxyacyl-CoA dehydrogenase [Colletotrichum navitas]|uniref:3-hydroxyacyl-CoA dehydrogenase n=1 Tax=Colletotrichum navitas TaxID=681940 RepID=A0AAD8PRI8_9PEZI|nr:3-hydroxyacyl-CoA dehydrogenase [Colletotrichum navitas]KAK1574461.1 3-hydroxyacyl-CoA dehydrogenase [Colletotrichum navitas]
MIFTSRPLLATACRQPSFRPSSRQTRQYSSHSPQTATPVVTPKWTPPSDPTSRPVVILGAGVLGRRLAVMWASTGRPVILHDVDPGALASAIVYIADALTTVCSVRETHPGHVTTSTVLENTCAARPWMVIEALPEDPEIKRAMLGRADALVPEDCILASNSSTWPTSALRNLVTRPERLLNTHYHLPPRNTYVELMTCGATDQNLAPFLEAQMRSVGFTPLALPRESVGFVFNRIWSAIKSDTLRVLQAELASPKDIDALFRDFFHAEKGPCEKMDEVGLDTVWQVERNRLGMGVLDPAKAGYTDWLEENYVSRGRLGEKTGDGLYSAKERSLLAEKRALVKSSYSKLR